LVREPREDIDSDILKFYQKALQICNQPVFHEGEWKLLPVGPAWESNEGFQNLLAWSWYWANQLKVVVINYSPTQSQGRVRLPLQLENGKLISYVDELADRKFQGYSDEINQQGLYIDLGAWSAHILDIPVR
jgi:hypothetical protein